MTDTLTYARFDGGAAHLDCVVGYGVVENRIQLVELALHRVDELRVVIAVHLPRRKVIQLSDTISLWKTAAD